MENMFLESLKNETNYTFTENGAYTHKTSNSYVLDYFAQGSALRNSDLDRIIKLFSKSFSEDKLLTMKILFYSRDIRGGQGERETFRRLINYLANTHSNVIENNIKLIPFFGRWDDLYSLFDTPLETKTMDLMKEQLEIDLKSENPSLLAKWMCSENTSSQISVNRARKTIKYFNWTPRKYRKILSVLRKKIDLVETKLTEKRYSDIDYSKIPSKAGLIYREAFRRNDEERYSEFLDKITSGEVKVNSKTLFPYEIVEKIFDEGCSFRYSHNNENTKLYNAMWKNLPDYIGDNSDNCIAVVDTSGSMEGTPMNVAISLGIYLAERNKGVFKNHYITFSDVPNLVELVGDDLSTKISNMEQINPSNTDINATFDLILNTAIKNNLPQSELPSRIIIISDMEFDSADGCENSWYGRKSVPKANFEIIKQKFKSNGYEMPKLAFWNVDSENDNIPMTMNEKGVTLVSGASPSMFEALLKDEFVSAYDLMMNVIGKERYDCVTI